MKETGRRRFRVRTPWSEAAELVGEAALLARAGTPKTVENYRGLGVPADALVPLLIPLVQMAQTTGALDPPPLRDLISAIRVIWSANAPKVWEALEHHVYAFRQAAELIRQAPTPEVPVRLVMGDPRPAEEGTPSNPPTRPTLIRAGTPPPPRRPRKRRR